MKRLVQLSMLVMCSFLITVIPALGQQFCEWTAPVNLGSLVNSSTNDFFSTISKDGLSLYFTSTRAGSIGPGSFDIWVSQRMSINWGSPQNLGSPINTVFGEFGRNFSPDGHTMYFASTRQPDNFGLPLPAPVTNDIYFSRRHNKRDDFDWLPPVNLGNGVNTEFNEANPEVFEDDSSGVITLYFDSNRPDGPGPYENDAAHNGHDIYASILQRDGTFGPAKLVEELSTPFIDRTVSISRDGLEIFFASNRPGSVLDSMSNPSLDLWTSTRTSTSDPWSLPVNLGPTVNSGSRDAAPSLSFDGTTLYFSSDRPGGQGLLDLYVTTRKKKQGKECQ